MALSTAPLIELSAQGDLQRHAGSGVGPRRVVWLEERGICGVCRGAGSVRCKACSGAGVLSRGGFNKRNTIPKEVVNSKWTAMTETVGWRHFRAIKQRKSSSAPSKLAAARSALQRSSATHTASQGVCPGGGEAHRPGGSAAAGAAPLGQKQTVFVLMQASCDPAAQLWVNRDALRDRSQWASGWLLRSEMNLAPTPSDGIDVDIDQTNSVGSSGMAQGGSGGAAGGAKPCRLCAGTGLTLCQPCDASGVLPINL